jgi:hypothetical protein
MLATTRIALGILAAAATLTMAGCTARAKTAANPVAPKPVAPMPPPPPPKLSTPQTQVTLPAAQPFDPAALDTATPAPADTTASKAPATPPARTPRTVRTETTAPQPAPATVAEPARPPIQEIISAPDLKRLQDSAQVRKKEVAGILEQYQNRRNSGPQRMKLNEIRNFVKLSDDFEKRGEMRQADAMAEKAQILARQLQNGK